MSLVEERLELDDRALEEVITEELLDAIKLLEAFADMLALLLPLPPPQALKKNPNITMYVN